MIIEDNENRYAVLGFRNGIEAWFVRWSLDSLLTDIMKYANVFSTYYDKMEIWVVTYNDQKIRLALSSDDSTWIKE